MGGLDVAREQEGGKGRIDDEVVLVGFDRAGFRRGARADLGVGGAKGTQGGEDGVECQGLDFDGDSGPVGEEAGLEFAMVCLAFRFCRGLRKGEEGPRGRFLVYRPHR